MCSASIHQQAGKPNEKSSRDGVSAPEPVVEEDTEGNAHRGNSSLLAEVSLEPWKGKTGMHTKSVSDARMISWETAKR